MEDFANNISKDKLIKMAKGTSVANSADVKGELIFDGIDNAALSLCHTELEVQLLEDGGLLHPATHPLGNRGLEDIEHLSPSY